MTSQKSSENDQSTGHFQSFFFIPLTLNLKKNPQIIKKNLALFILSKLSCEEQLGECCKYKI